MRFRHLLARASPGITSQVREGLRGGDAPAPIWSESETFLTFVISVHSGVPLMPGAQKFSVDSVPSLMPMTNLFAKKHIRISADGRLRTRKARKGRPKRSGDRQHIFVVMLLAQRAVSSSPCCSDVRPFDSLGL
jgi:hypothetical protein